MRKYILILSFISVFGYANAQDSTNVRRVHYGLKLSFNELSTSHSSSLDQVNPPVMKNFTNFSGAFMVDIRVAKNISLRPAIEYLTKGQQRKNYNSKTEEEYRVKYWQMPVHVLYHYKKFYGGVGPFASYAQKGTYSNGANTTDIKFGSNYYVDGSKRNSNWKEYDYGVSGSVGYSVWKFNIGLRYDYGLQDIDPHPSYQSKTRRAAIEVGILF